MTVLPSLMPALITPFDSGGEIDLDAHRHNLAFLTALGIEGFLVAGSTGEGPYLEPGERQQLIRAARDVLGDEVYLSCGVAAETARQAQAMIREAARGGADSALVITPTTLTRNRLQYVESYYRAVAEAAAIPLMLYSVPPVTAFELPEDLVVTLSRHPNVIGIKDSGGDPIRMQRLNAAVDPDFHLFTGSTQAVTLAITAGAYGAITASTNYLPSLLLETVAVAKKDPITAREPQRRISQTSRAVEALGIPGIKAAAAAIGLRPGIPRLPLEVLSESEAARVAGLVASA